MAARRKTWLLPISLLVVIIYYTRPLTRSAPGMKTSEILNQTLGFEEIFVLNLPERTDRRDAMTLIGAASGVQLTFVNGVKGGDVLEKTLPRGGRDRKPLSLGRVGSWRAHMNVLQRIVRENVTTALVIEDDVDWDVRLKSQLHRFSDASRLFLQHYADGQATHSPPVHVSPNAPQNEPPVISVLDAPRLPEPRSSPYGDDWDVLWLGHTGGEMPIDWQTIKSNTNHPPRSLLTITMPDETVPIPAHIKRHPWANKVERYSALFLPHTRVIHEPRGNGGVQAYAVTQRGARRLLHQFGLETFTELWDVSLRDFCEGVYTLEPAEEAPVCLTTQPPLIAQYWSKSDSDIGNIGGGYFRKTGSINIRHSVRLNQRRLLERSASMPGDEILGLADQWPDDGEGPW